MGWGWGVGGTKQFAGPGDLQVSSLLGKWREGARAKGTSGSCTAFRKAGHASIHTSRN